jgi:ribosomal protein S6--L-glutamate ligase
MAIKEIHNKILLGRNEWCKLPALHIPAIKAKIDTGAMTSAIHAFNIRLSSSGNVLFDVHPLQGREDIIVHCKSPCFGKKRVTSSNGHNEDRFVIKAILHLGKLKFQIELTLSNRDPLKYRMLLGREALGGRFLIDPSIYCNQKKMPAKEVERLYDEQ